jgi:hypothetical protein
MLLIVGLLVVPALSQEPVADTPQAPQSQPAAPPEAYRLDIRNVLAYQVISTTRVGMAAPTTMKYREMVVFDVDEQGDLIVCIGAPDLKALAAAPRPADKPAAAAPGERKPDGEEPEKVSLIWKRHVLGKNFTHNEDGTISFRPPQDEVMPYPVLPLPPTTLKEKERFDLTVPDLAMGEGKTLQLTGLPKVAQDGKLTVQCRIEPKIAPGSTPELAVVGYDIPAGAAAVSNIRMTRRLAGEVAGQSASEAQVTRPAGPHAAGERNRERPTPRPAGAAQQGKPTISVLLQLVSSKPVPEDLRKGLVNMASGQGLEHGDGQSESASESAATDKTSDTEGKATTAKGNLWDQIDQLGTQAKEKSEGATK